ncbi:uncharacterized protein PV09_02842 [Verruconis gallopava]|uniref:Uncharacterized protein n=1 Tax=Verruconis gallopava TaxID=253628 RepID=A0A0D2B585_9PEZI|nr:uncharacterized protein PV09_02842 [Verruconis gallopava]KIW06389.1 hypothetical protein PV09_02842 [Verruconis gallopava]
MARSRHGYDALSMHTLDDEDPETIASDRNTSATLIDYGKEPNVAAKEVPPSSPTRSSFSSSPQVTAMDWTPDTMSEFSQETAPLLGDETPPPEYQSPRTSLVVQQLPRTIGATVLESIRSRRSRHRRKDICENEECRRRHKKLIVMHVFLAIFVVSTVVSFICVSSVRKHKHNSQTNPVLPKWAQDCPNDDRYNYYSFDEVHDLEISEHSRRAFKGTVNILPALPGQSVDLVIKVLPKTKPFTLRVNNRNVDQLGSHVSRSKVGARSPGLEKRRRCNSANVILHFREGVTLTNLALRTSGGKIQVHSALRVTNATIITTKTAQIEASQFLNTRETYISSGSSSVRGTFKLYDVLSIQSTSGSIDVTVVPQRADKAHLKPAELAITSVSGSIRLKTKGDRPRREYLTTIESRDGMIQGSVLHGSKTSIKSISGMVDVEVLPQLIGTGVSSASQLNVETTSGRQQVTLRGPAFGTALGRMNSRHVSSSGALQLSYPMAWAGKISGESSSGAIDVDGQGVNVIEKSEHHVKAEKGEGDSLLAFRTESGSARVRFEL